ncbi:phosphoserine phosphatase [Vibrio ponticus]|nr:phosphoserine phosphatase [Vibrio ponticus]
MNLALFDFDGTITNQDAFTKFLFFATPKARTLAGFLVTSPVIALYKLGILPARYTRPVLAKVAFCHRTVEEVNALGARFVSEYLPSVIRPEALVALKWHQSQGNKIYLVSASLSLISISGVSNMASRWYVAVWLKRTNATPAAI